MNTLKSWISALRLRTLTLSLSSIGMGSFLAASHGAFNLKIFILCATTAVLLQILSNLANDYGDSEHGADNVKRRGPERAVQSGRISAENMFIAIVIFVILAFISGSYLLFTAFIPNRLPSVNSIYFFFLLGILAISAAVKYTAGKMPYGYVGMGDIVVMFFFGFIGVCGTYFLHQLQSLTIDFVWGAYIKFTVVLPAASCGFFSVAVLNINNIRDIESDKIAGKYTIPVRIGAYKAKIYHWFLLISGIVCALIYVMINYYSSWQLLFLISIPLLLNNGITVWNKQASELDPCLKQLSVATLIFVVTFGIGELM
ncbi:MAG: 1,4-dihydroxy-2-naphthoate polyprenyltransferase [Bacteroidetes bacterium]|nr:1,4-dihydroxy-2-naphthoate polyprenyltransferase [Bacteroidota bacterium]